MRSDATELRAMKSTADGADWSGIAKRYALLGIPSGSRVLECHIILAAAPSHTWLPTRSPTVRQRTGVVDSRLLLRALKSSKERP
jgi:hypothetical protein